MTLSTALETALNRIEDILAGDDGQAFKEARKFLPVGRAALAAQPGAVGEWKRVPVEPTEAMLMAGLKVHEYGWIEPCDEVLSCGVVEEAGISPESADSLNKESMAELAKQFRAMLAAAPTEAKPAQPTALTQAERRDLIDRAGDITDGLNQDDFADEIINQVLAAISVKKGG